MKLLFARTFERLARLRRGLGGLRPSVPRLLAALVVVAALEAFGRVSPSDWVDGVGVVALVGAAGLFVVSDAERWQRRARSLRERALRSLAPLAIRYGLDLRGRPPLRSRLPGRCAALWLAVLALAAGLWLARGAFPTGLRAALRGASGFVYLVQLALLWSALGFGTLAAWFGVAGFLEQELARVLGRERRLSRARALALALFFAAGTAAILLPPRWALALSIGACALFAVVLLCTTGSLRIVWRYAHGAGEPAWSRWGAWEAAAVLGIAALALLPALVAVGERFDGVEARATAATALFGELYLWSIATLFCLFLGTLAVRLARARLDDPARVLRPRVLVQGACSRSDRRRAARALGRAGFRAAFRSRPGAVEVRVRLVPSAGIEPASSAWPLALTLEQLEESSLHARLRRRDQIQRRRAFTRRIGKILALAARRDYERGEGFWIACNLWLATHLTRDTDEDDQRAIGPAYRNALPRAARSHYAEVLRDLDIDLVFLEDGVPFRGFRRVLAMIFEHHDLFGRRRLEDERHFAGLPGVRVLIHEFELERPLARTGYPEPDYEQLGRARILHVFRDRGDAWERADEPLDRRRRPVRPRLMPVLS